MGREIQFQYGRVREDMRPVNQAWCMVQPPFDTSGRKYLNRQEIFFINFSKYFKIVLLELLYERSWRRQMLFSIISVVLSFSKMLGCCFTARPSASQNPSSHIICIMEQIPVIPDLYP